MSSQHVELHCTFNYVINCDLRCGLIFDFSVRFSLRDAIQKIPEMVARCSQIRKSHLFAFLLRLFRAHYTHNNTSRFIYATITTGYIYNESLMQSPIAPERKTEGESYSPFFS